METKKETDRQRWRVERETDTTDRKRYRETDRETDRRRDIQVHIFDAVGAAAAE